MVLGAIAGNENTHALLFQKSGGNRLYKMYLPLAWNMPGNSVSNQKTAQGSHGATMFFLQSLKISSKKDLTWAA